ncbi:MAG: LysM peptidoglycan-binding domain-containing protein, partial [Candidatus Dormibacteraceae bacterium]
MQINRYATHAAVLLIAVVVSGYSVSVRLSPRQGSINAEAANTGGAVGSVSLGRDATIIKPVSIPTSVLPRHTPILYTVKQADTLDAIARAMGVPLREITWSNPGLHLPLNPGLVLRIPPVPGFVVVVKAGDSPASLGLKYSVDPTTVVDFNSQVRGQLTPGS